MTRAKRRGTFGTWTTDNKDDSVWTYGGHDLATVTTIDAGGPLTRTDDPKSRRRRGGRR